MAASITCLFERQPTLGLGPVLDPRTQRSRALTRNQALPVVAMAWNEKPGLPMPDSHGLVQDGTQPVLS